jgi:hypothetical protein
VTFDELLSVPRETRDEAWVEAFYAAVPDAPMTAGEVFGGPDAFAYLPLTPGGGTSLRAELDGCLERGTGVVVMTDAPEWVFPYGNLWSFKEHGAFALPVEESGPASGQVLVASPSEVVLPRWARRAIKRELEFQGAEHPGVLLVDMTSGSPPRSLAFDPMPVPERVLWYLPPHLGLMRVAEGWPEPMPL